MNAATLSQVLAVDFDIDLRKWCRDCGAELQREAVGDYDLSEDRLPDDVTDKGGAKVAAVAPGPCDRCGSKRRFIGVDTQAHPVTNPKALRS